MRGDTGHPQASDALQALLAAEAEASARLAAARDEAAGLVEEARQAGERLLGQVAEAVAAATARLEADLEHEREMARTRAQEREQHADALRTRWSSARRQALAEEVVASLLGEWSG